MSQQRLLVVFDFDDTFVSENTDYYVLKLVEEIPQEISSLYRDNDWIEYMGEVFKFLHQESHTREEILQCMTEIPLTEGMRELLEMKRPNCDIDFVIISDSNSVFISHILEFNDISQSILRTFTNPAEFDDKGCLSLKGYHHQKDCTLSSENLCKGDILKKFVEERRSSSVDYSRILYVGDGYNDLCPGLVLSERDFLLPRIGFKLEKIISRIMENDKPVKKTDLKATIVPWSSGLDIIKLIDTLLL